jgi:uncharacterized protein with LGFP repeats
VIPANTGFGGSGLTSGGAIFWSLSTQAHEVHGCIYQRYWHDFNGPNGILGFPVSDVKSVGSGQVSYFPGNGGCGVIGPYNSGSAIYYSSATGVYLMNGCIYGKYLGMGGPTNVNPLGFPTSDVVKPMNVTGGGSMVSFAGQSCVVPGAKPDASNGNSAIYYGPATGTHAVEGCTYYAYWHDYGGPGGNGTYNLGWPTSDTYSVGSGGDTRTNFEHGILTWIKATNQILLLKYNGDQTNNCVDQPNDTNCDGLPADACDDAYLIYVSGKPALADVWGTDPVTGARVHFGWTELFWSPSCASNFAVTFADTNNGSNAFVYAKVTRDNQNGTTKYYEASQNNQMTIYTRIIYSPAHPDQACGYITLVLKNGHKASDGSNPSASACTGWY